jgi:hypothetical protein
VVWITKYLRALIEGRAGGDPTAAIEKAYVDSAVGAEERYVESAAANGAAISKPIGEFIERRVGTKHITTAAAATAYAAWQDAVIAAWGGGQLRRWNQAKPEATAAEIVAAMATAAREGYDALRKALA